MAKTTKFITLITTWIVFIAYLLVGFLAGLWHPTWLLFLLIPIVEEFCEFYSRKDFRRFPVALIFVGAYLLVGFLTHIWHPTWVMLLAIPLQFITVNVFLNNGKSEKE